MSALPFDDSTLDSAYSLGVLLHVPDTAQAIRDVAAQLKFEAPFLVYLYYAFDNRTAVYRTFWRISDAGRLLLCRAPYPLQISAATVIACLIYWPLARMAAAREVRPAAALMAAQILPPPLLYVMRTDNFDKFCTRLEKRFTRAQITDMLRVAGFEDIRFSDTEPFWVALAFKR